MCFQVHTPIIIRYGGIRLEKNCEIYIFSSFNVTLVVPSAFAANSTAVSKDILKIADQKIEERLQLGHTEFEGVTVEKIIGMKDEYEELTKSLVVLQRESGVAGYFIIDNNSGLLIEFAMGDVYPGQGEDETNLYYLGPLFYANKVDSNTFEELSTDQTFEADSLQEIQVNRSNATDILDKASPSEAESLNSDIGINSIINYQYDFINGVPDYQQDDNTSMLNDCVPTAGASVIMYWRNKGYTNLSSSGLWRNIADRLGVIMDHNDLYGVFNNRIASGMNSYTSEKGYSNFTTTWASPTFSNMVSEVNAKTPGFLRLENYGYTPEGSDGGHLVTLVGYETYTDTSNWSNPQYAIVHDNWSSTGVNVYLLLGQYGSVTHLWKFKN
ncbi:C39 family peptidase [Paenibacillus lemnae]|uniref:Peptidase C39-like domain-containing protein n=1 Tax=Paenibacillus lemnae TaxID=1330551 RepID=A0A848M809_PAELE|nr:C39 family peptidase [Paenibacillus lemnae]NMO96341.1 hypothetical protein [Paenibacillus lemnae]